MDSSASTPLADYFWIAGLESVSYHDSLSSSQPQQVEETIEEHGEPDSDSPTSPTVSRSTARHSRQSSANRLSKLSLENRFSIATLDDIDGGTQSNRSSTTIKAPTQATTPGIWPDGTSLTATANGTANNNANGATNGANGLANGFVPGTGGSGLLNNPDFDFDQMLVRFAAERENFLEDLSFSAGAKLHARPPMVNPRAEKIKADDMDANGRRNPSALRSIKGSIRRKLSFRDMNSSVRMNSVRKPHMTQRAASVRTTKRLSNYNSVIPPPEPLNSDPHMHPLRRRFEPVLLDRYPPPSATEEIQRRGRFPDYVPMFAFPNDIQIVSSDDRPRSTWHGFTMTSDNNSKIYGITVIIWTALKADTAEEVEKRCELWRQSHMSDEERELASSLGMRLAAERANLSQLLAKLPTVSSGSAEREVLDDQISTVEEKISLMAEMLRPLRHGAASKIDGLTSGETGLWVPRAYGILGRDATRMSFWKEWLKAVVVPMGDGAVLRIPPSSPRVGRWQPLERYVVNLCTEAFSPLSSKTQVEVGVRELRLYARKEANNELPGSRNVDIYALFRCLSLENIVVLFEYVLSESRIIFLSSHSAMLHLACHAIVNLLYPLQWASVFIPLLPARLIAVLEAPCPYIVGIERRYENIDLPEDDFVLVDLDKDTIEATSPPTHLPRQLRRKLMSLLQMAAPHRLRYGVAAGPPPYAIETFPYDAFSTEHESLLNPIAPPSTLGKWVTQSSASFMESDGPGRVPIFNAFMQLRNESARSDRPQTAKSTTKTSPPASLSPLSTNFPPMPLTPTSRTDSGFGIAHTLREKRSGHFDESSRRSSSFGVADRSHPLHRPSLQYLNGHSHTQSLSVSVSSLSVDSQSSYGGYAPSTYAQSTLAASTVMPNMVVQPVYNTDTTMWVEGHCFNWTKEDASGTCGICEERSDGDGLYRCAGCGCLAHNRCLGLASLVCPEAFNAEKVRASFVRCFASLFYTYRKYLMRPNKDQKASGQVYAFDVNGFFRTLPGDQHEYFTMLKNTQAFNEFIHEREMHHAGHPTIRLFDEIILAKKARGRTGLSGLSGLSRLSTIKTAHGVLGASGAGGGGRQGNRVPAFLSDTSEHIWRTASVPVPSAKFPGEYRAVTTRMPSMLDPALMKEPRSIQGVPRPEQRGSRNLIRKQVASMLGPPAPTSA